MVTAWIYNHIPVQAPFATIRHDSKAQQLGCQSWLCDWIRRESNQIKYPARIANSTTTVA